MPVLAMSQAAPTTINGVTRDIFTATCSAWSCAPWTPGASHAVVTLLQFINATQRDKWAANIEMARDMLAEAWDYQHQAENATGPEDEAQKVICRNNMLNAYKLAKELSPCAILQGVNPDRKADTFKSLARVLCIDIDAPKPGEPDNGNGWVQDWEQVKTQLGALPWIAYAGISAGGRGVFMLIPIAREDAQSYAEYYNAWASLLQHHYNLITDASCKNRNRLRFMTHDPAPVINRAALVWDKWLQVPQDWRGAAQLATPCALDDEQKNMVRDAVNYCTRNGVSLADSYDDWMRLAAFFAHCWDDPEGNGLFHALASLSPKYRTGENERKLQNLAREHPNPVKIGTFVKLCKDNGVPVRGCSAHPVSAFKPWGWNTTTTPAPSTVEPMKRERSKENTDQSGPRQLRPEECPWNWPQERAQAPQDEPKPAAPAVTPPATQTTPQAPKMSESEAYIMEQAAGFISEGQGMLDRMRQANTELDALCRDLDLEYCGHTDSEGRGWIMSNAQFSAYCDQRNQQI